MNSFIKVKNEIIKEEKLSRDDLLLLKNQINELNRLTKLFATRYGKTITSSSSSSSSSAQVLKNSNEDEESKTHTHVNDEIKVPPRPLVTWQCHNSLMYCGPQKLTEGSIALFPSVFCNFCLDIFFINYTIPMY